MKMHRADFSHGNLCEVVSDVANPICGHARRGFGRECSISAPTVLHGEGADASVVPGRHSCVIPINWHGHSAKLVVDFK